MHWSGRTKSEACPSTPQIVEEFICAPGTPGGRMNHHRHDPLAGIKPPQPRHIRHRLFRAHPTRFERVNFAFRALLLAQPALVADAPLIG
jgi:hypothetical protein